MVDWIIKNFDKNRKTLKNKLFELVENDDLDITYETLIETVLPLISEDEYGREFTTERLTVIDWGSYQGIIVFVFALNTYQPDETETFTTFVNYGSCSYCDTLQSVLTSRRRYWDDEEYKNDDNKECVDGLFELCLHMIQRIKPISEELI